MEGRAGEKNKKYGFRFYNITKEMLSWPLDQTITDRICGKG
jgi:hypothetical protein